MKKTYLGDSVYADFDGLHIVLTTENGMGPEQIILLEDMVVEALQLFIDKIYKPSPEPKLDETDL